MHIPGRPHTEYVTECCGECKRAKENNPDPMQWNLIRFQSHGPFVALQVVYTNIKGEKYEKTKVIVIRGEITDFLKNRSLDPHFAIDGRVVARFQPNDEGWNDALIYMNNKGVPLKRG